MEAFWILQGFLLFSFLFNMFMNPLNKVSMDMFHHIVNDVQLHISISTCQPSDTPNLFGGHGSQDEKKQTNCSKMKWLIDFSGPSIFKSE